MPLQIVGPLYLEELCAWARERVSARRFPWPIELLFLADPDGPKIQLDVVATRKDEAPEFLAGVPVPEGAPPPQGRTWHARGFLHPAKFTGDFQADRETLVSQVFVMTSGLLENVLPFYFDVNGETMQELLTTAKALHDRAAVGAGPGGRPSGPNGIVR